MYNHPCVHGAQTITPPAWINVQKLFMIIRNAVLFTILNWLVFR